MSAYLLMKILVLMTIKQIWIGETDWSLVHVRCTWLKNYYFNLHISLRHEGSQSFRSNF